MCPIGPAESSLTGPQKGELPWFALQVRARHEVTIGGFLEAKGYEQFVPLYKIRKRWSDRIKVAEAPLFPGYLFCRIDPQHRLPILKTPGAIQIVSCNRIPEPIAAEEIQAIQTMIASGLQTEPWPFLSVGDHVRIDSGALRGLDGIVVKMKDNYRLVVSVTLLRRSVAVEIDSALVEPKRPATAEPVEERAERRQILDQPAVGSNLFKSPSLVKTSA